MFRFYTLLFIFGSGYQKLFDYLSPICRKAVTACPSTLIKSVLAGLWVDSFNVIRILRIAFSIPPASTTIFQGGNCKIGNIHTVTLLVMILY